MGSEGLVLALDHLGDDLDIERAALEPLGFTVVRASGDPEAFDRQLSKTDRLLTPSTRRSTTRCWNERCGVERSSRTQWATIRLTSRRPEGAASSWRTSPVTAQRKWRTTRWHWSWPSAAACCAETRSCGATPGAWSVSGHFTACEGERSVSSDLVGSRAPWLLADERSAFGSLRSTPVYLPTGDLTPRPSSSRI